MNYVAGILILLSLILTTLLELVIMTAMTLLNLFIIGSVMAIVGLSGLIKSYLPQSHNSKFNQRLKEMN